MAVRDLCQARTISGLVFVCLRLLSVPQTSFHFLRCLAEKFQSRSSCTEGRGALAKCRLEDFGSWARGDRAWGGGGPLQPVSGSRQGQRQAERSKHSGE